MTQCSKCSIWGKGLKKLGNLKLLSVANLNSFVARKHFCSLLITIANSCPHLNKFILECFRSQGVHQSPEAIYDIYLYKLPRNTIIVSSNLDSDQDRHSVGPDWVQTVFKGYQQTYFTLYGAISRLADD